ncbi:MAG: PAC2 family protein [Phycisphaerae bacterium]|nr:PAC2 family protein [Phycisphaerae bacterium]
MTVDRLRILGEANLRTPRLLMGFSGWMDGGDVSTGTVRVLVDKLYARRIAEIDHTGFYIYSFPGAMEVTSLFRPHCQIREGVIRRLVFPENAFFVSEEQDLILFSGKEPNMRWVEYGDCVFRLCEHFGVQSICFVGSVAGLVPHTRDPQFFCSVSDERTKPRIENYGIKLNDYEGPASIVTYLTSRAREEGIEMVALVATVPAYVQGANPKCVAIVTKRVAGILGVHLDMDDLQASADEFERRLTEVVQEQPELAESVTKLEQDYDNEVFSEMGDLKNWLHEKGIRLD